jgi:hypothetical protein
MPSVLEERSSVTLGRRGGCRGDVARYGPTLADKFIDADTVLGPVRGHTSTSGAIGVIGTTLRPI